MTAALVRKLPISPPWPASASSASEFIAGPTPSAGSRCGRSVVPRSSQAEVAELLQMSTRQVQNVEFNQHRREWKPPLEGWVAAFAERDPGPR